MVHVVFSAEEKVGGGGPSPRLVFVAVTFCERRLGKWDGMKGPPLPARIRDALNTPAKPKGACSSYRCPERLPGGIFAIDGWEEELIVDHSGKDRNLI